MEYVQLNKLHAMHFPQVSYFKTKAASNAKTPNIGEKNRNGLKSYKSDVKKIDIA